MMELLANLMSLKGKNALVTGGFGHLGFGMVEALAELGANVIVCSRDVDKHEEVIQKLNLEFGTDSMAMELDMRNVESIEELRKKVLEKYKQIDVLINNAYFGSGKDLLSMTDSDWIHGIDGSINSVFKMVRTFLSDMIKSGKGSIINIASMYGVVSPDVSIYEGNMFYNPPNYGAGKAAIIQLTKYIACVYGKNGIRCNSVSPGPFPNEFVQQDKTFIKKLVNKVPLGRIGQPYELKGIIALLASEASSFINGTNIIVDGGWTAW